MDYGNFELIINNESKQIKVYKYKKDLDIDVKDVFRICYNDWVGVSDDTINLLKTYIAKLTDNNMQITGCVSGDTISLHNNNHSKHYYVKFNSELEIELWYIEGVYQEYQFTDSFDVLLMMLSY
jgi:hypothetical protein